MFCGTRDTQFPEIRAKIEAQLALSCLFTSIYFSNLSTKIRLQSIFSILSIEKVSFQDLISLREILLPRSMRGRVSENGILNRNNFITSSSRAKTNF
jgi:hypothetical protein